MLGVLVGVAQLPGVVLDHWTLMLHEDVPMLTLPLVAALLG